ncbi:unnamed protein product, partial [Amoebophrya sp. A120]
LPEIKQTDPIEGISFCYRLQICLGLEICVVEAFASLGPSGNLCCQSSCRHFLHNCHDIRTFAKFAKKALTADSGVIKCTTKKGDKVLLLNLNRIHALQILLPFQ